MRAYMQAFIEILVRAFLQARAAYLAGSVWVHEQHASASFCRFADA
jgi:hypothetical protein